MRAGRDQRIASAIKTMERIGVSHIRADVNDTEYTGSYGDILVLIQIYLWDADTWVTISTGYPVNQGMFFRLVLDYNAETVILPSIEMLYTI